MSHPLDPTLQPETDWTKREKQTNLMKNRVETQDGDMIEIINGTLECPNNRKNLETIADWMSTEIIKGATIKVCGNEGEWINIDFPESVPTHKLESLLEHFVYQK
jgi:hypothetical protein